MLCEQQHSELLHTAAGHYTMAPLFDRMLCQTHLDTIGIMLWGREGARQLHCGIVSTHLVCAGCLHSSERTTCGVVTQAMLTRDLQHFISSTQCWEWVHDYLQSLNSSLLSIVELSLVWLTPHSVSILSTGSSQYRCITNDKPDNIQTPFQITDQGYFSASSLDLTASGRYECFSNISNATLTIYLTIIGKTTVLSYLIYWSLLIRLWTSSTYH